MFVGGLDAADVLAAIADRMHNDVETERKVVRNELAKINRTPPGAHARARGRLPELVGAPRSLRLV